MLLSKSLSWASLYPPSYLLSLSKLFKSLEGENLEIGPDPGITGFLIEKTFSSLLLQSRTRKSSRGVFKSMNYQRHSWQWLIHLNFHTRRLEIAFMPIAYYWNLLNRVYTMENSLTSSSDGSSSILGKFGRIVEFVTRAFYVNVPAYLLAKSPELDRIASFVFTYLLLQIVGFCWAFLVNAAFALACQTPQLMKLLGVDSVRLALQVAGSSPSFFLLPSSFFILLSPSTTYIPR